MKLRPVVLVVLATGCGLAGLWSPARAAERVQAGYWWTAQPDGGGVPAPPHVPPGGLYISSSPAGPQALAAVGFVLGDGEAGPRLVLRVHQVQQVDGFAVAAYPTTSAWRPGDTQPWSGRPVYDATAPAAKGALAADGKTVTFDIAGVTAGQSVSLVLAPVAAPGAVPPSFDVSFEQPAPGDVNTTAVEVLAPAEPVPTPPAPAFPSVVQPTDAFAISPAPGQPLFAPAPPSIPGASPAQRLVAPRRRPAATIQPIGRSRSVRDNVILAMLLFNGLLFLAWQTRRFRSGAVSHAPRISIYDLPPSAPASPEGS